MKKFQFLLSILAVTVSLSILMTGCSSKSGGTGGISEKADLSGVYMLDSTALGMPLQVYLTIKGDNTFQWTNKLKGGTDKGHGTIGQKDKTYLLLYSDSTNEAPKTAAFTVDGKVLNFSTRIPYGISGFSPNTEDENNIIYPQAKGLVYQDYISQYVSTSGDYDYTLELSFGAQYTVTSVKGDKAYTESGLFAIKDNVLTLTPKGGATVNATVGKDKTIALKGVKLDKGGATADLILKKAITADYAGTYFSTNNVTLTIDNLGEYTYTAGSYKEKGTFTGSEGDVKFKAANGATRIGSVANYQAKVSFPKTSGGKAEDITAYEHIIQGTLTASTKSEELGATYKGKLNLKPDGTYSFTVTTDGKKPYNEKGKFTTQLGAIGPSLVLTSNKRDTSTGIIAKTGSININTLVDSDLNEVGFKYTK